MTKGGVNLKGIKKIKLNNLKGIIKERKKEQKER
jgi:hypothetical protein